MAYFFDQGIGRSIVGWIPVWVHPNYLSVIRGTLVVPTIFWSDRPWIAVTLLILSSIFDIMDGTVARVRKQTSPLGARLDTASDKLYVLGTLLFACGHQVALSVRISIIALEVILLAIRPLKKHLGASESSNRWGGAKVWMQSIGIGFILSRNTLLVGLANHVIFFLALGLALMSLVAHTEDMLKRGPKASVNPAS